MIRTMTRARARVYVRAHKSVSRAHYKVRPMTICARQVQDLMRDADATRIYANVGANAFKCRDDNNTRRLARVALICLSKFEYK